MNTAIYSFIFILSLCFLSCVSSSVEEFYPEDYGVFDFPNDIKVYKASSEGMIDSTQYYATTSYNSFTKTATTNVNKTG